MDTVIFEEFKSTGNAELKLDRGLAEARIFPAIDLSGTGTRHDEALLGATELAIVARLRQALTGQDRRDALRQLLEQLRTTTSNNELLRRMARSIS
jgi:transcription termination factor Rho